MSLVCRVASANLLARHLPQRLGDKDFESWPNLCGNLSGMFATMDGSRERGHGWPERGPTHALLSLQCSPTSGHVIKSRAFQMMGLGTPQSRSCRTSMSRGRVLSSRIRSRMPHALQRIRFRMPEAMALVMAFWNSLAISSLRPRTRMERGWSMVGLVAKDTRMPRARQGMDAQDEPSKRPHRCHRQPEIKRADFEGESDASATRCADEPVSAAGGVWP